MSIDEMLTPEGRSVVHDVATRYDFDADAVGVVLAAIERGGGRQAQFSHPALGGMGQWSRNGMIMIGDMFNTDLKARVDRVCRDLADALAHRSLFEPGRTSGDGDRGGHWWPEGCGTPSATGAQHDMRYACFPEARRLAIRRDGVVSLYDTGDHRIGGVSQQQSGDQTLTFTSQHGLVKLNDLQRLDPIRAQAASSEFETPSTPAQAAAPEKPSVTADRGTDGIVPPSADDIFAKIERLHELQRKGILTDAEYADKKRELLARI